MAQFQMGLAHLHTFSVAYIGKPNYQVDLLMRLYQWRILSVWELV